MHKIYLRLLSLKQIKRRDKRILPLLTIVQMLWFLKIELLSEIFYSKKFSIFHLKPPGGVLIEYPYVYTIYTIFVCIHDIHTQISFSKLNGGGGLFKQPNRYIDLFERLREARTYIDRYLPGHISVSPRALF